MAKKITAISVYTKDGGWSTPYPIGSTVKEASATIAGILKAYTSTGSNTDGTMTQAAITQAIDNAKTTSNTASPTVAGVTKVYTSTGSSTDGTMTQAAITQAIDNAKTTINTASPTVAGVTKVYTSTGSSTDGTMTQAAITQAIDNAKTTTNTASPTVAGVTKVYTSTGSNTDGTMTQAAITQALSSIDALVTKTDDMKASFQAGVDGIYNAITAQGTTPASKSQSDVQAAISTLANDSYNKGYAAKSFRRILLGTGGNGNYSATDVPNWQGLTNDNFAFVPTKVHYWGGTYNTDGTAQYVTMGTSASGDIYPSVSYNAGNGIVTVTGCSAEAYSNGHDRHGSAANVAVTGNIYCVVADQ